MEKVAFEFFQDSMLKKKTVFISLLLGTLQFVDTTFTTEEPGWSNLLCHKVKELDEEL